MAKGKVLSVDLKLRIVNAYNSGMNFGTAAKQFSVSKLTVQYIMRNYGKQDA